MWGRLFLLILTLTLGLAACSNSKEHKQVLHGIDVSHFQHTIDWSSVKGDAIDFAYIKVSEGITITDAQLKANWTGAAENNFIYGGYHIFVPGDDGAAQANNYLHSLQSVASSYAQRLRPVLDVESVPKDKLAEALPHMKTWLQSVEKVLGCKPMIYTSPNNWDREFPGDFTSYPLWLADYNNPPALPEGWKKWTFWQHTNNGNISGIAVPVDLDVYEGGKVRIVRDTCPEK